MKKVMVLAVMAVLMISSLMAQNNKLSFEKVIKVDSIQKQFIYNGIKEWIGMNFVSSKNVIEVDDKDVGIIIINALTDYSMGKLRYLAYEGYLRYTIKLQIKDGRFKIEITNFTHQVNNSPSYWSIGILSNSEEFQGKCSGMERSYFNKVWNDLKQKSESLSVTIINEFEKIHFESNENDNKSDNW